MYFSKCKFIHAFAISQCCLLCASEHMDTWWDETGKLSPEYYSYLIWSSFSAVSQVMEGIELDRLKLVEVAVLGPVQSWCAEGEVAFLTDYLNADGFNPSK